MRATLITSHDFTELERMRATPITRNDFPQLISLFIKTTQFTCAGAGICAEKFHAKLGVC